MGLNRVEICSNCKGYGRYDDGDRFKDDYVKCEQCLGSGKVSVCTYTVTLPFNCIPDGMDTNIHNEMRKALEYVKSKAYEREEIINNLLDE